MSFHPPHTLPLAPTVEYTLQHGFSRVLHISASPKTRRTRVLSERMRTEDGTHSLPIFRTVGVSLCQALKVLKVHARGTSAVVKICGDDASSVWRILYNDKTTPEEMRKEIGAALKQQELGQCKNQNVVPITRIAFLVSRKASTPPDDEWCGLASQLSPILVEDPTTQPRDQESRWVILDPDGFEAFDRSRDYSAVAFESPRKKKTLRVGFEKVGFQKAATRLVRMVAWLHSKGVAHCDLRMDNLVMNEDVSTLEFIDFGFCKVRGAMPDSPLAVPSGTTFEDYVQKDWRQLGLLLLEPFLNLNDACRENPAFGKMVATVLSGDDLVKETMGESLPGIQTCVQLLAGHRIATLTDRELQLAVRYIINPPNTRQRKRSSDTPASAEPKQTKR